MKKLFVAVSALAVAACGGSGEATIKMNLTDAPFDSAKAATLKVTIDEVKVHVVVKDDTAGKTEGSEDGKASEKGTTGWKTVCSTPAEFDLLTLTGGKETPMCADAKIDAGKITQIRLVVSKGVITWKDGSEASNLEIPSGTIKIVGNQEVAEDSTLNMTLDFDAAASVIEAGSKYQLKPTIKIAKAE